MRLYVCNRVVEVDERLTVIPAFTSCVQLCSELGNRHSHEGACVLCMQVHHQGPQAESIGESVTLKP